MSFFGGYSEVPEDMMALRPIVLQRKSSRPIYHMAVLRQEGGDVKVVETPCTPEGVTTAYIERFAPVQHLVAASEADLAAFTL